MPGKKPWSSPRVLPTAPEQNFSSSQARLLSIENWSPMFGYKGDIRSSEAAHLYKRDLEDLYEYFHFCTEVEFKCQKSTTGTSNPHCTSEAWLTPEQQHL